MARPERPLMTFEDFRELLPYFDDIQLGYLKLALQRERAERRQYRWDNAKAEIESILRKYQFRLRDLYPRTTRHRKR